MPDPKMLEAISGLTMVLLTFNEKQSKIIAILDLMNQALILMSDKLDKIEAAMPNPLDVA